MHRTIVLGLLLAAAACGRDRRESQEVALGDTASALIDSSSADLTKTPAAAPLPANQPEPAAQAAPESAAPKPAAAKPPAQEPAPQPAPPSGRRLSPKTPMSSRNSSCSWRTHRSDGCN